MQIVVRIRPELSGESLDEIFERTRSHGINLTLLHPSTTESTLAGYYIANVDDPAAAEKLVVDLRKLDGVDAAYIKPVDDVP